MRSVAVPEPAGKRLYAASTLAGGRAVLRFGARFPHGREEETVLPRGKIRICDDKHDADRRGACGSRFIIGLPAADEAFREVPAPTERVLELISELDERRAGKSPRVRQSY